MKLLHSQLADIQHNGRRQHRRIDIDICRSNGINKSACARALGAPIKKRLRKKILYLNNCVVVVVVVANF